MLPKATPANQQTPGPVMIDSKAHGGLHQCRDDIEDAQGQAQLHITHAKKIRQQGKQGRQHHDVQMTDKVRRCYLRKQSDMNNRHG